MERDVDSDSFHLQRRPSFPITPPLKTRPRREEETSSPLPLSHSASRHLCCVTGPTHLRPSPSPSLPPCFSTPNFRPLLSTDEARPRPAPPPNSLTSSAPAVAVCSFLLLLLLLVNLRCPLGLHTQSCIQAQG